MAAAWARGAVFTALIWACLTCAATAQTLTFPALSGRVVDEGALLDATDRGALSDALADLQAKTADQLVIVTLKSLQGTTIENYGYQLGRRWKIGQKDKDSGVLLIVAGTERKVRIEVGYGLEGTLTDALTKVIIETVILPRFKAGDLPGGIKLGTEQIIHVLSGNPDDLRPTVAPNAAAASPPNTDTSTWPIILVVVTGVGLLIYCTIVRGGGLCRVILQLLFLMILSGRGKSSRGKSSFSGGGGSFGGGGSSGSW